MKRTSSEQDLNQNCQFICKTDTDGPQPAGPCLGVVLDSGNEERKDNLFSQTTDHFGSHKCRRFQHCAQSDRTKVKE